MVMPNLLSLRLFVTLDTPRPYVVLRDYEFQRSYLSLSFSRAERVTNTKRHINFTAVMH